MYKFMFAMVLTAGCMMCGGSSRATSVCTSMEYRQFDFLLGSWNARLPGGKITGTDHFDREYDGCVIHERYVTSTNYSGESLNIYDASRKVWHQTWVDNLGDLLVLEGGLHEGKMIMEGQTVDAHGVAENRLTWTPNTNGSVRQLWESADKPGHWTVKFDLLFTQK